METRYVRNERELRYALMQIGATTEPLPGLPVEVGGVRIDWAKPSVVDALKRLERAGSEQSRLTEKLLDAAHILSQHVVEHLPHDVQLGANVYGAEMVECPLPRNIAIDRQWQLAYWDHMIGRYLAVDYNREIALRFAADIADGWLDELAEWLEQRAAEDEAAAETIEQAERG